MKYRLILLCLLMGGVSFHLKADVFETLLDKVVCENSGINAEIKRALAENLSLKAANRLGDPEVSFEGLFGRNGENKYNIGLVQSFDWPGAYRARRFQAKLALEVGNASIALMQSDLKQQAASLIIDIAASKMKIAEYEEMSSRLNELLSHYMEGYESGDISILDVNKLRIEKAATMSSLMTERQNLGTLTADLEALYSDDSVSRTIESISAFPALSLQPLEYYTALLTPSNAPELHLAELRSRIALSNVKVVEAENRPGFSLGYRFSHEDGTIFNGLTFSMTLPIWSGSIKRQSSLLERESADIERNATYRKLVKEITKNYADAMLDKSRLAEYGRALLTSDNLGLLRQAFDGGQIDLSTYIQEINFFLSAKIDLYEIQRCYYNNLVKLAALSGQI